LASTAKQLSILMCIICGQLHLNQQSPVCENLIFQWFCMISLFPNLINDAGKRQWEVNLLLGHVCPFSGQKNRQLQRLHYCSLVTFTL
jgi:hypothetical protein